MKELILRVTTKTIENNLPDFAKELRNVLASVNTDLKTDEDFAEAKDLVKKFDTSEKALKSAKERIFESGELSKINALINELTEECRTTRLTLNRAVTSKEKQVKQELIDNASKTIQQAINNSVMCPYLTVDYSDIANEIKGKKLLSKMEEALNTYVGVKINAIQVEESALLTKKKLIEELIKGNDPLFNLEHLMRSDDYENVIKSRIQANDEAIAERAKIEAEKQMDQERKAQQIAKSKADKLAQDAQNKSKSPKPVEYELSGVTEFINADILSGKESVEVVNQYRIRLDVTCCLDEAKSIATELKNDYSRLGAIVSLNQVNSTEVA